MNEERGQRRDPYHVCGSSGGREVPVLVTSKEGATLNLTGSVKVAGLAANKTD